jgi:hypothetical protein
MLYIEIAIITALILLNGLLAMAELAVLPTIPTAGPGRSQCGRVAAGAGTCIRSRKVPVHGPNRDHARRRLVRGPSEFIETIRVHGIGRLANSAQRFHCSAIRTQTFLGTWPCVCIRLHAARISPKESWSHPFRCFLPLLLIYGTKYASTI